MGWKNDSHHRNDNKLVVAWALLPHRICWHSYDVISRAALGRPMQQPILFACYHPLPCSVSNLIFYMLVIKKYIPVVSVGHRAYKQFQIGVNMLLPP